MSKPKVVHDQENALKNIIAKYANKPKQIQHCVYRLSYAGKYIIVKGKTLIGSLNQIQDGYSWYDEDSLKDNVFYLYRHFFSHIKANPKGRFRLKMLSRSTNPYFLLKREQLELDKGRFDSNMMNNSTEAYIPIYREKTGLYGWVSPAHVMNFKKWLKIRDK